MVARMKVSGTARPTVAPAPCGLMLTARLAPIAAMDNEIAPQVLSVRRSTGVCDSVEGPFVVVICSAPPGDRGVRRFPSYDGFSVVRAEIRRPGGRRSNLFARLRRNLGIMRRSDNDEALTRLFGGSE